jgi:hypothetical protein
MAQHSCMTLTNDEDSKIVSRARLRLRLRFKSLGFHAVS